MNLKICWLKIGQDIYSLVGAAFEESDIEEEGEAIANSAPTELIAKSAPITTTDPAKKRKKHDDCKGAKNKKEKRRR